MIQNIISGLTVIAGVLFGDYLASLAFGSVKGLKEFFAEIIAFLVLLNFFLLNIAVINLYFIQLIVYFIVSLVSIISARSIVFLLFHKLPARIFLKHDKFNSSLIRLAKLLNNKLPKRAVIKIFRKAGFGTAFQKHLEAVLKE